MWFYLKSWFAVVCLIVMCICTSRCSFLGLSFQAYSGLLVQGQRRSFEIGENGGPTLFTESFNRGALSGLPSRRDFLNLFSAFGRNCQFDKPATPPAADPHQTISLQLPEISHQCRALPSQPNTQFPQRPTTPRFP